MQRDPQQPPDPLDDLLGEAHWPDPSRVAIDRLEQTWDRLSPARPRSNLKHILAIAATLLIAGASVAIVLWRPRAVPSVVHIWKEGRSGEVQRGRTPLQRGASPLPSARHETAAVIAMAKFVPRTPTPLEALAIRKELARPQLLPAKQGTAAIDDALLKLSRPSDADPAALAMDLKRHVSSDLLITSLCNRAMASNDPTQSAAIRLLALVGTDQSAACLMPLLHQKNTRGEALNAICRLANLPTLWRLMPMAQDDAEQRQLIAAALRRDPSAAMPQYLRLIENPQTRDVALDALDELDHPPVPQLIAVLSAPRIADRFDAARALGHIDGPNTTAQLVTRIQNNISRHEALAALLLSRGEQARIAVAQARQSYALAPLVQAVQSELEPELNQTKSQ